MEPHQSARGAMKEAESVDTVRGGGPKSTAGESGAEAEAVQRRGTAGESGAKTEVSPAVGGTAGRRESASAAAALSQPWR